MLYIRLVLYYPVWIMSVKFGLDVFLLMLNYMKKIQLEAARIVTYLPSYASRESLYHWNWVDDFKVKKRDAQSKPFL